MNHILHILHITYIKYIRRCGAFLIPWRVSGDYVISDSSQPLCQATAITLENSEFIAGLLQ